GGALEDKAVHDLALTCSLLNPPLKAPLVTRAEIENFMVGQWKAVVADRPSFVTVDDWVVQVLDRRYTEINDDKKDLLAADIADARVGLNLRWPTARGEVECEYSFAWDGVDDDLRSELAGLDLPPWVGGRWSLSVGERKSRYYASEARIHILTGSDNSKL